MSFGLISLLLTLRALNSRFSLIAVILILFSVYVAVFVFMQRRIRQNANHFSQNPSSPPRVGMEKKKHGK